MHISLYTSTPSLHLIFGLPLHLLSSSLSCLYPLHSLLLTKHLKVLLLTFPVKCISTTTTFINRFICPSVPQLRHSFLKFKKLFPLTLQFTYFTNNDFTYTRMVCWKHYSPLSCSNVLTSTVIVLFLFPYIFSVTRSHNS